MLREVKQAGFHRTGAWPLRRWSFVAGRVQGRRGIGRGGLNRLLEDQAHAPVVLCEAGARRYWMYADRFFWEDEELAAEDVRALAEQRLRRDRRRLERARVELSREESPAMRRSPIPRAIRRRVFERDGGRCCTCGCSFDLQYDHVIPVALGGASTEENLELLCADCNRSKGAAL